jgi:hypothetical protein
MVRSIDSRSRGGRLVLVFFDRELAVMVGSCLICCFLMEVEAVVGAGDITSRGGVNCSRGGEYGTTGVRDRALDGVSEGERDALRPLARVADKYAFIVSGRGTFSGEVKDASELVCL